MPTMRSIKEEGTCITYEYIIELLSLGIKLSILKYFHFQSEECHIC